MAAHDAHSGSTDNSDTDSSTPLTWRTLIQLLPDPVCVVDGTFLILEANRAMWQLLGTVLPAADIELIEAAATPRAAAIALAEHGWMAPLYGSVPRVLRTSEPLDGIRTTVTHANGKRSILNASMRPVRIDSGTHAVLVTIDDITAEHDARTALVTIEQAVLVAQGDLNHARSLERARTAERQRIARDLHDGVQQKLIALRWALNAAGTDTELLVELEHVEHVLRSQTSALHSVIDGLDLTDALTHIAADVTVPLSITIGPTAAATVTSPAVIELIWRAVREFVRNADLHASATRVTVAVTAEKSVVTATVTDNGVGIDMGAVANAQHDGHLGLVTVRESISLAGGTVSVRNTGQGTTATATIPYQPGLR
jgi:signal transduction histidine kinase